MTVAFEMKAGKFVSGGTWPTGSVWKQGEATRQGDRLKEHLSDGRLRSPCLFSHPMQVVRCIRMRSIEIRLGRTSNESSVPAVLEQTCESFGLRLTLKGTLKRHPGSLHWHFKKGDRRGTLEVTFWPRMNRAWLSVQEGRTGNWIDEVIVPLKDRMEQQLGRGRERQP